MVLKRVLLFEYHSCRTLVDMQFTSWKEQVDGDHLGKLVKVFFQLSVEIDDGGVCQVVLDDTCIHSDSDSSSVSDDRGSVSLRGGALSPRRRTTHLRLTNRGIVQLALRRGESTAVAVFYHDEHETAKDRFNEFASRVLDMFAETWGEKVDSMKHLFEDENSDAAEIIAPFVPFREELEKLARYEKLLI